MALYRDVCEELARDGYTKEVYRFQGAKTCSKIEIGQKKPKDKGYIYVSGSMDHHMYFTMKRLKQMINKVLLEETGERFSARNIQSTEMYSTIRNLILYSDGLQPLYSYRLVCSDVLDSLMKNYCVRNDQKESGKRYIERVDRRVYGGGYGLGDEWKELLDYLTFFTASTTITRKDLLELVANMRRSGKINKKDNLSFLTEALRRYQFDVNPNALSDFNKYNIANALESIVEKEMVLPDSDLAISPRKVIKSVVEDYERGREKTLELLGRRY